MNIDINWWAWHKIEFGFYYMPLLNLCVGRNGMLLGLLFIEIAITRKKNVIKYLKPKTI